MYVHLVQSSQSHETGSLTNRENHLINLFNFKISWQMCMTCPLKLFHLSGPFTNCINHCGSIYCKTCPADVWNWISFYWWPEIHQVGKSRAIDDIWKGPIHQLTCHQSIEGKCVLTDITTRSEIIIFILKHNICSWAPYELAKTIFSILFDFAKIFANFASTMRTWYKLRRRLDYVDTVSAWYWGTEINNIIASSL